MNRTAAEGPDSWALVTVDDIQYKVSRKKAEIHYEGKDAACLHLLLNSDKHRRGLADKATLVHREEEGGWLAERPDSWSVHAGGKTLKISWDGSIPSDKQKNPLREEGSSKMSTKKEAAAAKSLADAALAAVKATPRKASPDINQMAREKFNKSVDQLSEDEMRQLLKDMQAQLPQQPAAPVAPAPAAPLVPGMASATVRWMRSAEDDKKAPPFEKKDDKAEDKKDEKKSDEPKSEKKDEKAPEKSEKKDDSKKDDSKKDAPKKDKAPSKPKEKKNPKDTPAGDAKDAKDAEKAIDILEKLLDKEKSEGEPHALEVEKALEILRKFLAEEKSEHGPDDHDILDHAPKAPAPGIPVKVDLPVVGPASPAGPVKPPMPAPLPKPMPLASKEAEVGGFREGDQVWHKDEAGQEYDPGRVVAIGGGKVIVDWGDADGVLAEYKATELVRASTRSGESDLFAAEGGSELPEVVDEEPIEDEKSQIETILSSMSVKDVMDKKSAAGSNKNAIEHIATGRAGEFLANTSDGRCLVRIDGEELFVWPYEIKFDGDQPLF